MFARSEFGHDSAKPLMSGNLRRNHGRDDLAAITHDGRGSFIAGSFDSEYEHGLVVTIT
jgi:hypothetical protein